MARPRCPDEDELVRYVDRRVPASRARVLEAHFKLCPSCRRLVSALALGPW